MPCTHPIVARYDGEKVFFPRTEGWIPYNSKVINLPCGKCISCRREYARSWAVRCSHEAKMHEDNCFITLTFNNESLPPDGSLNVATFQNFMKKVRNHTGLTGLKYFHCGEYGEKKGRPHYHILLFGYDFPDKKFHKASLKDFPLYTSEQLNQLWPYGYHYIGDVSFESASYVARYVFKKTDDRKKEHKMLNRLPEYCTMSRRPSIGASWYAENGWKSCHANDVINYKRNGKIYQTRPPRYYDELLKKLSPELYQKVKDKRLLKMDVPFNAPRYEGDRLSVLEEVGIIQVKKQIRRLEEID